MTVRESVQQGKPQGYIKTISVTINPFHNGGESVDLSVDIFDNGDGLPEGLFTNTHIKAQCYGTHCSQLSLFSVNFSQLAAGIQTLEDAIFNEN